MEISIYFYLFVYLFVHLFVDLFVCLFICLFIYLFIYLLFIFFIYFWEREGIFLAVSVLWLLALISTLLCSCAELLDFGGTACAVSPFLLTGFNYC